MTKIKVDKAVPGEEAACDDCEFYKHARDMQGQEFHFCTKIGGQGFANPPKRILYKMSECDFFSKDKSEFDFDLDDEHSAWHIVTAQDPRDADKTMELFLTPGEYWEYQRSFGTIPQSAFLRRGIGRKNESKTKPKRARRSK